MSCQYNYCFAPSLTANCTYIFGDYLVACFLTEEVIIKTRQTNCCNFSFVPENVKLREVGC